MAIPFIKASREGRGRVWVGVGGAGGLVDVVGGAVDGGASEVGGIAVGEGVGVIVGVIVIAG